MTSKPRAAATVPINTIRSFRSPTIWVVVDKLLDSPSVVSENRVMRGSAPCG